MRAIMITRMITILFFKTLNGNNAAAVRITSAGNVGIGTTNPKSALHVTGAVNYNNQNTPGVEIGVHVSNYAAIEMTGAAEHQRLDRFQKP